MPIALLPADPDHATILWRIGAEAPSRRFNPTSGLTFAEFRQRLAANSGDLQARLSDYRWVVIQDHVVIGHVTLRDCNWLLGHATLGYGLTESVHGRGLGTEAVRQVIDMAFARTDLQRLTAGVHEENHASRRLLQKLGFSAEGVLRENLVIGGERVNEVIYGLLRREWQAHSR